MGVFSVGTPSYLLPPLAAVLRPRHNSGAPPQSAHPRGCLQPGYLWGAAQAGGALGRLSPGSLDRFYLMQSGCGP